MHVSVVKHATLLVIVFFWKHIVSFSYTDVLVLLMGCHFCVLNISIENCELVYVAAFLQAKGA